MPSKDPVPPPVQADALQPEIKEALAAPPAGTYPEQKPLAPGVAKPSSEAPVAAGAGTAGTPLEVASFHNVTKKFGEGAEEKVAIQDVSFVVEDLPEMGELICLVG